jgi:transposase
MFVRTKQKPNGKYAIQIVESVRRGDKVSQSIVRHLGQATTEDELIELKALAHKICVELENKRKPVLPLFDPEDIYGPDAKKNRRARDFDKDTVRVKDIREEQRIVEGPGEVFGQLFRDLGFSSVIKSRNKSTQWNDILASCVVARLANPASKSRTAALLEEDYGIKIPLEKIFRMMDHIDPNRVKELVGKSTLSLFPEDVDILFYDVTTLHFESQDVDSIRNFGFSKNSKFNEVQVVLALVCTKDGLPVTYNLYPGNTYEGSTLIHAIDELLAKFKIAKIFIAADRGMFSEANLKHMDEKGVNYVVGATLRRMSDAKKEEILDGDGYVLKESCEDLFWTKEFKHTESRRLIVCYNSKRAACDAKKRIKLKEKLLAALEKSKAVKSTLKPAWQKYLTSKGSVELDPNKFEEEARWDGVFGLITNCQNITAQETIERYRGLWRIEESFRVSKHDLKMRPIFHWTENRIEAHIAICFLALAVARHATYRMKTSGHPMSFEKIRNELLHVQASIMHDASTKKRFVVPSSIHADQRKIYRVFGVERSASAYGIN